MRHLCCSLVLLICVACSKQDDTPIIKLPTPIPKAPQDPVIPKAEPKAEPKEENTGTTPAPTPMVFCPTATGTEWTYRIDLKECEPLVYSEVSWPEGDGSTTMAVRGRIWPADKKDKPFTLKYRIKGQAKQQGELKYPIGAELEILEDDLKIFRDAKQIFFAASESGGVMVHRVVTYSPDSSGAPRGPWGGWNQKDGFSMGLYFFARKPGTGISMKNSPDTLIFAGLDVEKIKEGSLHFTRVVEGGKKEGKDDTDGVSILRKPFTEDMWFVIDKGLVLLEQKVDGKPSMTWTLVDFKKGT